MQTSTRYSTMSDWLRRLSRMVEHQALMVTWRREVSGQKQQTRLSYRKPLAFFE